MNAHFASLVLGLAHQAEAALRRQLPPGAEGAGDARVGGADPDRHARHAGRQDRGRLEPDERQLLDQTLTALRFRFVQTDAAPVMRRAAIIVLDGLGIGPAAGHRRLRRRRQQHAGQRRPRGRRPSPAAARGARPRALRAARPGVAAVPDPAAAYGICEPASAGKDSTTGHWEICGLVLDTPFPTYPDGFPDRGHRGVRAAHRARRAGQPGRARAPRILDDFGEEHQRTGKLDRLHLGGQRLPGGGARGDGAARPSCTPPAPPRASCCRASTGSPG